MRQRTEIETIYRNDDVLVVYKPGNIPSAPLTCAGDEFCLVNEVRKTEPGIMNASGTLIREGGLIHRLDTPTSGLVLFALNQRAYDNLIAQQKKDLIIKQYRAVFTSKKGAPEGFIPYTGYDVASSCGYISSYFRSFGPKGAQVRPVTNPKAKNCSGVLYTTQTEVESSNSVLCTITRGFRHQIRVHMAWAGYPLAGDTLYGGDEADVFGLEAVSLTFANPSDGQVLTITL